jgi:hypothetical protein
MTDFDSQGRSQSDQHPVVLRCDKGKPGMSPKRAIASATSLLGFQNRTQSGVGCR